jgi:hypothetical protein
VTEPQLPRFNANATAPPTFEVELQRESRIRRRRRRVRAVRRMADVTCGIIATVLVLTLLRLLIP